MKIYLLSILLFISFFAKGQVAWDKLFEKYQILQKIDSNGSFVLKATEIKEFYEPGINLIQYGDVHGN